MEKAKKLKGKSSLNLQTMVKIALLSAIAAILMFLEIPLWFAPGFYKLDLSEIAVLIGSFSMGVIPGIIIEALKILLHLLIKGTSTAGVGEISNFIIGLTLVVPSTIIFRRHKTLKSAVIGLLVGALSMAVIGALMNYLVLIPFYSKAYGMPLDAIIGMGTKVNSHIVDLKTLVFWAVVPFNILKAVISGAVTLLLYKKLSPIISGDAAKEI